MNNEVNVNVSAPVVETLLYQQGPRGVGIKTIAQENNRIKITLDNNLSFYVNFPDWWFGTKDEYNNLSIAERDSYFLHFILEGS